MSIISQWLWAQMIQWDEGQPHRAQNGSLRTE